MKKLSFIFALILTANTYSDGLNSYLMDVTTEYNLNTKNTKTTWNAGEGTYQLNDKYSFGFDVDRIYTDSKNIQIQKKFLLNLVFMEVKN